jgi:hypothetical protein
MKASRRRIVVVCVVPVVVLAIATGAGAGVPFSNSAPITINDNAVANPYPSQIVVSGLTGTITDVNVSLVGLSHQFSHDVAVLLLGPGMTPKKVRLMADCGGASGAITNVNLTFDDEAASAPASVNTTTCQGTLVNGTFLPGQNGLPGACPFPNPFPQPAPGFPYGAALSNFDFADPNGTWSLYVVDDCVTNTGSIAGGWSLDITTSTAVTMAGITARTTKAGVLLRWRTGTEVDLLGFQIYRSRGHSWQRITHALITAKGSVSGAAYRFLDRTARRGVAYRYRIKSLNRDGTTTWFGPVSVG